MHLEKDRVSEIFFNGPDRLADLMDKERKHLSTCKLCMGRLAKLIARAEVEGNREEE